MLVIKIIPDNFKTRFPQIQKVCLSQFWLDLIDTISFGRDMKMNINDAHKKQTEHLNTSTPAHTHTRHTYKTHATKDR